MEVTVLTGFAGYPAYQPGEVVDLAPAVAKAWIAEGLAKRDETAGHSNDEALTALHDQSTRERAKLARRRADVERQKSDLLTAVARTRNLDLEYRDPDDPDRLAYEHARLERLREVAPLDAKLREIDAALDEIPRQHERERAEIAARPVGPLINVPEVPADLLATAPDAQSDKLQAQLAALHVERDQVDADRPTLERAAHRAADDLEAMAAKHRAKLATHDELRATSKVADQARQAVEQNETRRADLDRRMGLTQAQLEQREAAREAARQGRLSEAVATARMQAARDLIRSMASMTYLDRLCAVDGAGSLGFAELNADAPRAAGREWLQQLAERGIGSRS